VQALARFDAGVGVGKHEQLAAARLRNDITCAGLSVIRPCWTMES
jgi:hypothetical protein